MQSKIKLHLRLLLFLLAGVVGMGRLQAQVDCPVSTPLSITVHQDPTISITGATTICEGGTATLNATVGNGTGTCTIEWQSSLDGVAWAPIASSNNAAYTTPALSVTTQYRARYSCDGTDCDPVVSNTQTITVQPDPGVTVTGAGQTVCNGGVVTLTAVVANGTGTISYQWQKSENGGTTWTNVGTNSDQYTTDALTTTTQYKVIITQTGAGCDGAESTPVTVTVVPDPDITASGATSVCVGGNATLSATVSGGTGTCTIQWQYLDGATWTNIAGETNANYNSGALTTSTVYRAMFSCTGLACDPKVSNTQQITVVNDPSVGISGGAVTICSSGSVTMNADVTGGAGTPSYQWESSLNGTTFTTIAGATNQSYTASNLTVTTYYRVKVTFTGSGCDEVYSAVSIITVVADPIVSIGTPGSLCVGGNVDLTATTANGTGTCTLQWQRQVGASWVDIAGATNNVYNTGALSVTTNYRVRYFCTGGGCDEVFSTPVTVNVASEPTIVDDPIGGAICQGGTHVMTVTSTGGAPTPVYTWQYNNGGTWANVANNTPTGATYTTNVAGDELTVAGVTAIGSYEYRAVVSASGSSCDPDASASATIQVVQDPAIDVQPTGGTICVNGTHTMTVAASGGTPTLFYQWEYNNGGTWAAVADGTPAGAAYMGSDAASMAASGFTAAGTYQYRVVVSATGSNCGTVVSETKTIVVEPALVVSVQPQGAQICVDGTHMMSATVTGGSNLTYQWQYNNSGTWADVANNTPAGATYTGATGTSLTVTGIDNAGSYQYRLVTTSQGNNCGNIVTNVATVTVANPLAITTQPQGASICDGGTHTMSVVVTGGHTLSYTWQIKNGAAWQNVANGFPTGATYTGASTASLTAEGITVMGSYEYRVITASNGDNCGDILSDVATLTVSPSLAITAQPTGQSICVDGGHTMSVTVIGGNSVTYQWEYNNGGTWGAVADGTPVGAVYTGGTTASLTASGFDNAGTYQYRVVATSQGNNCGNIVSNTASITVVPDLVFTTQPVGDTICVAGSTAPTSFSAVATGGTPTINYQWQIFDSGLWVPVVNGTPTGATYTGGTTASLGIAGATQIGSYQYRVVISATGNGCAPPVASSAVTLKVAQDPTITTQPVSAIICRGGEHTMNIAATGGTPSLNYQWQYNNGGTWENVADGAPAGADYTSATPYSLQVVGITATGNHEYRIIVTATGNGCGQATSNSATITVNEEVSATITGGGQTVCVGGTADISATVTGGTGTLSYQWQIKPASGSWSNIAGATTTNLTTPALTETSEFRIVITSTGSGCDAFTSTAVTINVVPDPVITISGVSDVCVGGGVLISSNVTGGTGTCVISWQLSTNGGTTFSDIVPPATGPTYQTPALTNNAQYRAKIVCSGNGCCD